jgi:hypothetical protein
MSASSRTINDGLAFVGTRGALAGDVISSIRTSPFVLLRDRHDLQAIADDLMCGTQFIEQCLIEIRRIEHGWSHMHRVSEHDTPLAPTRS